MKRKTWIKKAATALLILAMCLGGFHGIVPDTARASANPDAVDAEIDVEKINLPADFIEGVDVSSYDSLKNSGVKFYDFDGNELDYNGFFTLLKDSGINYVRLRVWNNPFDADGHGYGGGNNSIGNAKKMGKAASDAGLKVLIDFYYSDFWAGPGRQQAPKAWADYTVDQKADAIETYTYDSLKELIEAGVDVGMVQIGNETNGSFCGESGWENCAKLFNAGARAVRNVGSEKGMNILVALHFTNPEQRLNYTGIAEALDFNNVDYDVFASSYYPDRHGTLDNLKSVLTDIAVFYNKKVMVAETSWATTLEDGDGHGNTISGGSAGIDAYSMSVQGQADAVSAVIRTVANTENGIGVFYWEPAWIPVQVYHPDAGDAAAVLEQNKQLWEEYGSGWASSHAQEYDAEAAGICGGSRVDNQAMFDFEGHPLDSLNVWKYVKTGAVLAPISCSLDGGTTWTGCDSLENVLFDVSGYGSCKNPIIRLNKDITVDGAVSLLINNNNVLIDGQGHTITRGSNQGYLFSDNGQAGTLTFRNVTIDGGAVWDNAQNVKERTNSGLSAGGDAWLIYCWDAGTKVILDNGAILQNNHLNDSAYNGAAVMMESGSLTMKAGAVIRNNTAIGKSGNIGGGGGAVHVDSGASFTMEGGEIYGNYASLSGGAIVNQGSFTLTGGVIHDNVSGNNGGAVSAQGAIVISGGEIRNNESYAGGGIAVLSGTTKISGGAVQGNTATSGGGVYNNANMSVSGTARIYNNSQGNVYLPSSKIINIDAPLSDGAAIGVKTQTAPADGSPVNITGANGADYSSFFTSDNADYEIVNGENNVVQLTVKTHTHSLTLTAAKDATCTEDGNKAYYTCEGCGKWFSDENGTQEITDKNSVIIKAGHNFDNSAWGYQNEEGHAHNCRNCGTHDTVLEHTPGAEATETTPQTCTECGYVIAEAVGHTHSLTLTAAKGATCTEDGNKAYYTCEGCGKWFSDENGTQEITDKNSVIIKAGHNFDNSAWGYQTADGHAHNCQSCDAHDTVLAHTPGAAATETTPQTCTVCGYVIAEAVGHTHSLTLTAAKGATCTENGNKAYYTCGGCDKWFTDAAGAQEITDKDSVVIPKTGHSYDGSAWGYQTEEGHAHNCQSCGAHDTVLAHTPGAAATETTPQTCTVCGYEIAPATGESHTHHYGGWQQDDTQHWKVCSCGDETGRGSHDFGDWITDKEATATEAGTKHRECRTCGYRQTETIPAMGTEPGTVISEVKPGENVPATRISNLTEELEDMLLTDNERSQVQNGTDIRIVLEVKDASDNVSNGDKALVEEALTGNGAAKGFAVGQYLDVSLFKIVGESRSTISETSRKITVTITVPDSLKNTDSSKQRKFAVIRVHDGRAELLEDMDNSADTITIETDRFSTYTIVYGDAAKDDEPKTGDVSPLELCAALILFVCIGWLVLYFTDWKRKRTEERKKELLRRR